MYTSERNANVATLLLVFISRCAYFAIINVFMFHDMVILEINLVALKFLLSLFESLLLGHYGCLWSDLFKI